MDERFPKLCARRVPVFLREAPDEQTLGCPTAGKTHTQQASREHSGVIDDEEITFV
jgi:hypothetical protein